MDDDEDVPLNPAPSEKPKMPEGIAAFSIGNARSGADMFEEENAAIAGEDVTIIVQLPDKELEVKMKMGHTVELLKLKARELLGDTSIKLVCMRLRHALCSSREHGQAFRCGPDRGLCVLPTPNGRKFAAQELRLADSDQVLIDPLSLNDYPIDSKDTVKVKGAIL